MKRAVMVIVDDSTTINGEWYDVDYNSEPMFPDYADSTEQDFNELIKVLNNNNLTSNDYRRWYTI